MSKYVVGITFVNFDNQLQNYNSLCQIHYSRNWTPKMKISVSASVSAMSLFKITCVVRFLGKGPSVNTSSSYFFLSEKIGVEGVEAS